MPNNQHHTLPATKHAPALRWHISEDEITLSLVGGTAMENAVEWYTPIFEWLEHAFSTFQHIPFTITAHFRYVNTSSAKVLLDLFDRLREEYETTEREVFAVYIIDAGDEDMESDAKEWFSEWDQERYSIEWKDNA